MTGKVASMTWGQSIAARIPGLIGPKRFERTCQTAKMKPTHHHPTGGRRRKGKCPPLLPDLPPLSLGEASSDDLADEKSEPKRLRSTSTTPRVPKG